MKFEESLKKLSDIVDELESGSISLDKAIKKYQDGMIISKKCFQMLEEAEKQVQVCVKDKKGRIKIKPFAEK